jgi:3-deoxy-D-manno-octulosonate 8-phosphate phosphatase (KDO 8-P phosphatase)
VRRGSTRSRGQTRSTLVRQFGSLALVVFDFDGVMTDNRVLVTDDGREAAWCNRSDGIGLAALRRVGFPMLILSTEANPIVAHRARKLQIECVHGCDDKWAMLSGILQARSIVPSLVAYVGNDTNDVECMKNVGLPICVADGWAPARRVARFVTERPGGHGAVREICDLILQSRGAAL